MSVQPRYHSPILGTVSEFHPDFLSHYDQIIFDMDGVLIHGTEFMPGIVDTLNLLKKDKNVYFCTNNSTQHRTHFYPWFKDAGVEAPTEGHLYTAASTAASSVFNDLFGNVVPKDENDPHYDTKFLVIGQPGLIQEFSDLGLARHIVTLSDLRAEGQQNDVHAIKNFKVDPNIKAVVAGLQVDFSWRDCAIAVMIIRENNTPFYATDRDATFPASHTRQLPGCGAIINMIEASAGRKAMAMGKPTKYMIGAIQRDHPDMDLSRTLMVGDRLDTDIAFGNNFGMGSFLVFSGVTKKMDFESDKIIHRVNREVSYPIINEQNSNPVQKNIDEQPQTPQTPQTPTSPLPLINIHDPSVPQPTYCAENITWMFNIGGVKKEE